MLDVASLQSICDNYGAEGKPLFIGKTYSLENVKMLNPFQYLVVIPLGGDDYKVESIVDRDTAIKGVDSRSNIRFSKIIVQGCVVYIVRVCLGSAVGLTGSMGHISKNL